MSRRRKKKAYIPDRNDLLWLDFDPVIGKEIGKRRPALVLSSKAYNQKTELMICSPVSTQIRSVSTEVVVDNLDKPSVVAANIILTLSWKDRSPEFIKEAEKGVHEEVVLKIMPLIGAEAVLADYFDDD